MQCTLNIEDGAGEQKHVFKHARIYLSSAIPIFKFHLVIEYKNEKGEEEQEGGYYDTLTLHYEHGKDSIVILAINSPIHHKQIFMEELQHGKASQ